MATCSSATNFALPSSLPNSEFLANLPPPKHPMLYPPNSMLYPPNSAVESSALGPTDPMDLHSHSSSSDDCTVTVTTTDGPIPSVIFAIPFPEPGPGVRKTSKTPMCMLYSLPRAIYIKPKTIDGKKGKENLIKKAERKWQEQIQESQNIKDGKLENPSTWKKLKAVVLNAASRALTWMLDNNIETVARLPHGRKIGKIIVVYPHEEDDVTSNPIDRQPEQVREDVEDNLIRSRQKAILKTVVSAVFLPFTAAIEIFCVVPTFIFEVNFVYFCLQINGSRKIAMLFKAKRNGKKRQGRRASELRFNGNKTAPPQNQKQEYELPYSSPLPNEPNAGEIFEMQKSHPKVFRPVLAHLYSLCSAAHPLAFPSRRNGSSIPPFRPDREMVVDLIDSFKTRVPPDVALRHNLNPEFVAKDLRRSIKKAAKAYIQTLKKVK